MLSSLSFLPLATLSGDMHHLLELMKSYSTEQMVTLKKEYAMEKQQMMVSGGDQDYDRIRRNGDDGQIILSYHSC